MSLIIRRIAVDGFRKFRAPFAIEGMVDGLNIVIEPNESGKSTLLEALRAAFFVRHNTRNQLAQSFAPHGEAVGPEIKVGFDVDGAPWTITKRFLRSPLVEISGPQGRAQGEEAESRLNALLGSVRDTSRNGDISTYGVLGLLWVAQTEALSVSAPGQIVRDTITSTLEAEVGSIIGGEAYRRVRAQVDAQFSLYWTPTGQKKGRQTEAYDRAEAAETAAREAAERLAALERSFTELEASRGRLRSVQREIADNTDVQTRKDLAASLEIARAAAQILSTRKAEKEAATGKLSSLADLKDRYETAIAARDTAMIALEAARVRRVGVAEALARAKNKAATARAALDSARTERQAARSALAAGEERMRLSRRLAAIAAARRRHEVLQTLEGQHSDAKAVAATAISAELITALEEHDRAVAAAQAIVSAGATRITLSGQTNGVTLDGQPMQIGERALTRAAHIRFGAVELIVTPPTAAASVEETLASALRKRKAALEQLGVEDLAAARARNEAARDAAAELHTLEARITAVTLADDVLAIAAGAEALKLFMSELEEASTQDDDVLPDIPALTKTLETADANLAPAEGMQDSAIEALRRAEGEDAPLAATEAGAVSDLANATSMIERIKARPEWATLDTDLTKARETAAEAAVKLEDATRDATAYDVTAINRKIEIIDARARTSAEARTKLETEIARLEGTIESEGGLGLADRAAAAREEAEAARAALQRVTEDAETLKLLRDTLEAARNETSAKFAGPVAKRAKRYIEQLLPDCELTFSEDLAVDSVVRAGVDEHCASLSRGTQEQLAVLTRIAFADMLIEQGKPVSLILDDPLVYSDDGRLDTMIEILSEAATRMQVILLTCRDRAFRHVPGYRLMIAAS
jgi:DNA repair exonuclease SbcCD ATPase subunit